MSLKQQLQDFFETNHSLVHASAPGRLDVMGGIGDYSGSYVLQMPIAERTDVYLAIRKDSLLRARSRTASTCGLSDTVELSLKDFSIQNDDYSAIREQLNARPDTSWVAYIFGCVLALMREYKVRVSGVDIFVDTNIPLGKGVSSSAALEVATLSALCHVYNITLPENDLPILAQRVENQIVGAPCGLMDQLATYFGKENKLLPILCQPDIVFPAIDIPRDVYFIGIDSGERHSVGGSSYTGVRTAAFMGYTIIASSLSIDQNEIRKAKDTG